MSRIPKDGKVYFMDERGFLLNPVKPQRYTRVYAVDSIGQLPREKNQKDSEIQIGGYVMLNGVTFRKFDPQVKIKIGNKREAHPVIYSIFGGKTIVSISDHYFSLGVKLTDLPVNTPLYLMGKFTGIDDRSRYHIEPIKLGLAFRENPTL